MLIEEIFARLNKKGNYDILTIDEGESVTRIDYEGAKTICPIDSSFSIKYEHPKGIELSEYDVKRIGIEIEQ